MDNTGNSNPFKSYRKRSVTLMRPYVGGEDLTGISVSEIDDPAWGGMIAMNPSNHADRWYVSEKFFADNYEEVGEAGVAS